MIYAILAVLLVAADQLTKYLTRANIPLGENITFIPHLLDLTYVQNTGAAFSILREHTWLVICWMVMKKFFTNWLGRTSAMLILAGGVGNLIDRAAFGYVTDMIETVFMDFPVFNVADCCITVGVVLLFIYVIFFVKDEQKEEKADDSRDLPADGN